MASKSAASEAPSLRDLSAEIQRASIKAKAELADARARLGEMRGQRELLLSAPLHSSDLASEIQRHLEKKGREAIEFLRSYAQEIRDKTAAIATTAPDQMAIFDPFDRSYLTEVVAFLADPEAAAQRILQAVGDDLDGKVPEGLPLVERRAALADLDRKIQAAESHEAELIAGLQAAGIQVSMPNDPIPEPKPGDEKVINGKLSRWVSYTGIPGTYGWMAVDRIEQAA